MMNNTKNYINDINNENNKAKNYVNPTNEGRNIANNYINATNEERNIANNIAMYDEYKSEIYTHMTNTDMFGGNESAPYTHLTDTDIFDGNESAPYTHLTNTDMFEKRGLARHYSPGTKEWKNSNYSYNKNYEKTSAVAYNTVNELIRSYLNISPLVNKKRSKLVVRRFRRLSLNQTLVSKTELKHTNNKVTITAYLYNKNKKSLMYNLKNLYTPASNTDKRNKKNKTSKSLLLKTNKKSKNLFLKKNILNKKTFLKTKNKLITKKNILNNIKGSTRINNNKSYKILTSKNPNLTNNYLKIKMKFISLRVVKLISRIERHKNLLCKTFNWDDTEFLDYKNKLYTNYMKESQKIELMYMYYIKMLTLNNNKFKNWFLLGLNKTVSRLYNKKVEFNFVNLRYLHLNSDIFAQSIVTRIRNRKNSLNKVLSKALILAKTPLKNFTVSNNTFLYLKGNINTYNNKHKPLALITNGNTTPDLRSKKYDWLETSLDKLLTPNKNNDLSLVRVPYSNTFKTKLLNILAAIRYKSVLGVRLEAAGRLSKRLTASRSLFKLKYKGGIRDTYNDITNVSSVILRGNNRPNIQYSLVNNKTRNGSFGLKTWINAF